MKISWERRISEKEVYHEDKMVPHNALIPEIFEAYIKD